MVALIPARVGSKRIPGKNTKLLGGVPLITWAILAAQYCLRQWDVERDGWDDGPLTRVVVCSDDPDALRIANRWGVSALLRTADTSTDDAPDVLWVRQALAWADPRPQAFCILRPTSPFRSAETIRRAYAQWQRESDCIDSLRAVRPVTETPYKMWTQSQPGMPMMPLLSGAHPDGTPYHSSPTQTLPTVYVQTGGLEMGWTRNVECLGSISGRKISPFIVEGPASLDINEERDWAEAERLLATGAVQPPAVPVAGVSRAAP